MEGARLKTVSRMRSLMDVSSSAPPILKSIGGIT